MIKISIQFFGGRGGGGSGGARGGGRSGGGGGGKTKSQAISEVNSLKAPKMGQSVSVTFDEKTAIITRVRPGYRQRYGSNTMFAVNVTDSSGKTLFRTNRRGSSAFKEAKDDIRLTLGLNH